MCSAGKENEALQLLDELANNAIKERRYVWNLQVATLSYVQVSLQLKYSGTSVMWDWH